jgi:hypothetical protein
VSLLVEVAMIDEIEDVLSEEEMEADWQKLLARCIAEGLIQPEPAVDTL